MIKFSYFLLGISLFFFTSQVIAQQNVLLKFEQEAHDFGTFNEGKVVEHTFTFTNISAKPIKLSNVQASCGCTTPSWTQDSIPPNGIGKVTASYNSAGRPGGFIKNIALTANGFTTEHYTLVIRGNVIGSFLSEANQVNGILALEKDSHNFGKMQLKEEIIKQFSFVNKGTSDLTITTVYANCNCVVLKKSSGIVKPNETGFIELVYSPQKLGKQEETVSIYTNSTTQPMVVLTLKGEVVETFGAKSLMKEGE